MKDEIVNENKYLQEVANENVINAPLDIKSIRIENLSYRYPKSKKNVLDRLNFQFQKGKIH